MTARKERSANRRRQRKINTILSIAGSFLVVIVSVFLLSSKSPVRSISPARVGTVLSNFKLTDITGKRVQLNDYSGKIVLINAWATWCPPCLAEMPELNAYYQAHRDTGFELLAINAGDSASEAAAFADMAGLSFPVLLDPDTVLLDSLGIHSYPTSILVGSDGVVKTIHVGMFTSQSLGAEITPYLP
jgi:peroxiredoxin